jgi:hypothetical protein
VLAPVALKLILPEISPAKVAEFKRTYMVLFTIPPNGAMFKELEKPELGLKDT